METTIPPRLAIDAHQFSPTDNDIRMNSTGGSGVTRIVELISTHCDRVAPDATLRDVASLMMTLKISSVIVVDQGVAVGIITEHDLLRATRRHHSPDRPARSVMSSPVHSVPEDMEFHRAYREAANLGIRHIVVAGASGEPLGAVSESDFRKFLGPDFYLHLNCADTLMERRFPRLPASTRLDEALIAMEAVHGSCVVVVDGRQPIGIVTERDIVRLFLNGDDNPPLDSIMTRPPVSIREDCPLTDAASQMAEQGIRHLTVVNNAGELVGLLTEHTLMHPLKAGLLDEALGDRQLAEERQRLAASVFDNAHEGIMITDPHGMIVEVNASFTELTGYTREEALGKTADLLKSGHHDASFYDEMWQKIRDESYWRGEVWNRKKSGEIFVVLLTISSVRKRNGETSHFVAIFSDITLIKQHQQRLEHLAHFDALTQLPNRMLLGDRMQLAMSQTDRSGRMLAVCYLDLDNFKPINDQFGHAAGDYLLIEVAQRLKTCVRAGDTVSRLGGDEFVLLISNLSDLHECDQAIARVASTLAHPFHVSEHNVAISASIGVTLYPQDNADPETLLRHADQAMYAAKQAGRNRYHLFDPEHDRRARAHRDELGRIREALAKDEFRLYYQPKVDMRKGHVIGAEALIRWQHPEHGLLLPDQFLPTIEGNELSIQVGDWVIREALRQIEEWHTQGLHLAISINISGNHLQHEGFARRLSEQLTGHPGVLPGQIELEVLETAALEDIATIAQLFTECRQLGISFALDDFGTGYSSLTYFRRLPADTLKIDQSFIRGMLDDPEDLAIVEGVIGLTQAFQRKVIAEGVETVEHGLVLLLLGCDMAQGFGIARPMPADQLPEWIRQFRPDELWSLATAFQWSRDDLPMLIAEVDHKRWIKALHAYLDDRSSQVPTPPLDSHSCRFGHWYYNHNGQRYAHLDSFRAVEATHNDLHETSTRMVRLHEAGKHAEVDAMKPELERLNEQLTACIQEIQAAALMEAQRP
jgi:diguanylate cyclase (GGDEF)-like protein/PAS domain S-box-containing protein